MYYFLVIIIRYKSLNIKILPFSIKQKINIDLRIGINNISKEIYNYLENAYIIKNNGNILNYIEYLFNSDLWTDKDDLYELYIDYYIVHNHGCDFIYDYKEFIDDFSK